MSIYVAVILDQNENIMKTWACYADNIHEAKQIFHEEFGSVVDSYKVLFRIVMEN